ncbi:Protein of unknown function [Evansella caseinilytica]|uniref:DUF3231 family protein n=1 Tax=Evansella caseinilytica TaxID=1503961 RepID=A0A1H3UYJ7_9BACI|nr:DUF3231 family protein [Evansella caseinilytica]SDZ66879.1 Protein of unknown function [Evansella caseinilytica]
MVVKNPVSSSELGTLWLTYQEKTLILRVLEYFIEKSTDRQAKNIMGGLWQDLDHNVTKIKEIFYNDGVVVPVGFTDEDVNLEAPPLYSNGFDILFVRILKEISMGMYTINMNMAYRDDIISIYEDLSTSTQKIYKLATKYLLKNGFLNLPPIVAYPKATEFIENKSYLNGFQPFKNPRALTDIELGILHHGIETNIAGVQLITGFSQCAQDKEVKKFFIKGKELAKKQIKIFTEILIKNEIPFSATSQSTVTTSTIAPFSQKLMMFCVYLLNGFGLVGNSFGTVFSLRNDLSLKMALVAKDIFLYSKEGIDIMIKNHWMEEPPQTENRAQFTK